MTPAQKGELSQRSGVSAATKNNKTNDKKMQEEGEVVHVGTILLQVSAASGGAATSQPVVPATTTTTGAAPAPAPRSTETERRDVYVNDSRFKGAPYYFTHTGNHVLVVDQSRIDYFPKMDPHSREVARRIKYEAERPMREEAERKERERIEQRDRDRLDAMAAKMLRESEQESSEKKKQS